MNTRIARRLNTARKATDAVLDKIASEIVEIYNQAIENGYIEGVTVDYVKVTPCDEETNIDLIPVCGMITLDDLYNIKTLWGADDVIVFTGAKGLFSLCFKIK